VFGAAEIRELALEGFHFRPNHEGGVFANPVKRRENFVPELRILRFQIQDSDLHRAATLGRTKTLL
jgi:hypothetical protein